MISVKRDIIPFILITLLGYIGLTFSILHKKLSISLFPLKLKKLALCNPGGVIKFYIKIAQIIQHHI